MRERRETEEESREKGADSENNGREREESNMQGEWREGNRECMREKAGMREKEQ